MFHTNTFLSVPASAWELLMSLSSIDPLVQMQAAVSDWGGLTPNPNGLQICKAANTVSNSAPYWLGCKGVALVHSKLHCRRRWLAARAFTYREALSRTSSSRKPLLTRLRITSKPLDRRDPSPCFVDLLLAFLFIFEAWTWNMFKTKFECRFSWAFQIKRWAGQVRWMKKLYSRSNARTTSGG